MKYLIVAMLICQCLYARTLVKNNNEYRLITKKIKIKELVKDYAKINNINLFTADKMIREYSVNGPRTFSEEAFKVYLSSILATSGFTAVENKELNELRIINARDVRYTSTQTFNEINKVPNNFNYYTYTMKIKNIEGRDISRNLRPFMSRYGRVIDITSDTIIISDSGKNIHRLEELVKFLDQPEFNADKNNVIKMNISQSTEVKESLSFMTILSDNKILFVILFFIVGIMFGFTGRGYMMKRIEGGW